VNLALDGYASAEDWQCPMTSWLACVRPSSRASRAAARPHSISMHASLASAKPPRRTPHPTLRPRQLRPGRRRTIRIAESGRVTLRLAHRVECAPIPLRRSPRIEPKSRGIIPFRAPHGGTRGLSAGQSPRINTSRGARLDNSGRKVLVGGLMNVPPCDG